MPSQPMIQADELRSQVDFCSSNYLRLPYFLMQKCGSASQTLAAIVELMDVRNRQCFASKQVIADTACLKLEAVRKHVLKLAALEIVHDLGRHNRRTPTYEVDDFAMQTGQRFGALPRWAARAFLSWSDKAVYSYYVSQFQLSDRLRSEAKGTIDEHYVGQKSVRQLSDILGLDKEAVSKSLQFLSYPEGGEPLLERWFEGNKNRAPSYAINPLFRVRILTKSL